MEARASAKYLRGSPQKARLVVDMIRGKNVNDALAVLRYTNKRAADGIEKCVRSAVANATEAAEKENVAVDPDELWVKACYIDMGPTKNRRRVRPAPQGRAYRERRHFHHVTVLLSSDDQPVTKKHGKNAKPAAATRSKRAAAPKRKVAKTPAAESATAPAAETTTEQATEE
ncbi:MAG: 50S ribosomal protein L22 [Acidobacteriota bacterium]|nr:50S ribosomal protein L22 [Acidobacteriota bacterium]